MTARRRSGELSGLVLDVLREADGPRTAGEVHDRLRRAGVDPLAYTTVLTILARLHANGVIDRSKAGRAHAYRGPASEAELVGRRMRRLLDAEPDRASVLASFIDGLSAHDEQVLRALLGEQLAGDGAERRSGQQG